MNLSNSPSQSQASHASSRDQLLLRSLAALLSRSRASEAAVGFCTELCELLRCVRASVGVLDERGILNLAGSSHPAELQPARPAASALVDAMQEALDQQDVVAWPPLEGKDLITLAQRQLAASGAACTVPLVDGIRVVGALTIEQDSPFEPAELAVLHHLALLAGPVVELQRKLSMPWHSRLVQNVRGRLATPTRRRAAIGGAVAFLVLALAVPVPWRVSAPARLEGSVHRAVVAATDGFLRQANVRPGDRVRAGQVLAELASDDLELERRRRESELRQHESGYRAAQARADRTQMVTVQAKASEAQALLSLVETQLRRARIEAPFDGIVIKGDLSQNLGSPVQRGELLMVLAPNDSFRLILEVDEADIGAIRVGQAGQLALAAQPDRTLRFMTRRIVPVAATGEGRNYFEVEATLEEALPQLRPGLSGVAKVFVGRRPVAWLLGHRAVDWLRLAWWKVTPW